jgi:hypothetical protein
LNNAAFRAANLKGLKDENLKDPEGTKAELVDTPAAKVYAYETTTATGAVCDNTTKDCVKYMLIATLSDGKTTRVPVVQE